MRIRQHFLLGTDGATISATAKTDCDRETLFRHTMESILIRYLEEFGPEACKTLIEHLATMKIPENVEWRRKPEDSCWSLMQTERE